jgi:Sigma-70 region 2
VRLTRRSAGVGGRWVALRSHTVGCILGGVTGDLGEVFEAERGRLFGLAYRLLGSASDAEDVVQSAFLRWNAADRAAVAQPAAWLTTVVTDVMVQRFLHRMVVVNCLPPPEQGLAGRAPVGIADCPGLFVAGDWVGPEGSLSDGSLVSGEQAGRLAASGA